MKFDEQGDVGKVCCRSDKEILEKIKQFKEEKRKELEYSKQSAEGEEEKRILRSRLGYTWLDGDSKGRNEEGLIDSKEEEFQSAKKFLQNLLSKTGTGLACLTGPPASGKTVTMQKIVCTHAATQTPDIQMEEDGTSAVLHPRRTSRNVSATVRRDCRQEPGAGDQPLSSQPHDRVV